MPEDTQKTFFIKSALDDAKYRLKKNKDRKVKDQNTSMLIRLMEIENRTKNYSLQNSVGFED